MKVKKVTIKESRVTTFLVPDHLDVSGKTREDIGLELYKITETRTPLVLSEQNVVDRTVAEEQIDGIMMERFREHYSQIKC